MNCDLCPPMDLIHRFWVHENKHKLSFAKDILATLMKLGIPYSNCNVTLEYDLTQAFRDGFTYPHQKYVLDFFSHTKLSNYPREVAEICIEYLSKISQGKPEKCIVEIPTAVIILSD